MSAKSLWRPVVRLLVLKSSRGMKLSSLTIHFYRNALGIGGIGTYPEIQILCLAGVALDCKCVTTPLRCLVLRVLYVCCVK